MKTLLIIHLLLTLFAITYAARVDRSRKLTGNKITGFYFLTLLANTILPIVNIVYAIKGVFGMILLCITFLISRFVLFLKLITS